ncbi:MAG: hypothetical protein K0S93_1721 [Nitrososphaeraceae archaeon]|jgi:hypothetical protein|nr:hypothetical protein [Nitrososphaeraceae archaeon]
MLYLINTNMESKIQSIVLISILAFALTTVIPGIYENVLAQEDEDTELGGDPELGGDAGMTESDLGGNDTGMTVSDIENDTEITNGQTGEGIGTDGE